MTNQLNDEDENKYVDKLDKLLEESEAIKEEKPQYVCEPENKKSNKGLIWGICIGSIVIVVIVFVLLFVTSKKEDTTEKETSTQPETTIEMVDLKSLIGLKVDEARGILDGKQLKLIIEEYENSLEFSEGEIISQNPSEGEVSINSEVKVIVSRGPESKKIPNVIGKSLKEARKIIEGLGYVVIVEKEYSTDVCKDYVIEIDKEIGDEYPVGSAITLTVSKGEEPTQSSPLNQIPQYQNQDDEDDREITQEETTTLKVVSIGSRAEYNDLSKGKINSIKNIIENYCYGQVDNEKNNLAKYMSANGETDANATYFKLTNNSSTDYKTKIITTKIDSDTNACIEMAQDEAIKKIGQINSDYGVGVSSFIQEEGYYIYIVVVY